MIRNSKKNFENERKEVKKKYIYTYANVVASNSSEIRSIIEKKYNTMATLETSRRKEGAMRSRLASSEG